jgi:hypothetical protein
MFFTFLYQARWQSLKTQSPKLSYNMICRNVPKTKHSALSNWRNFQKNELKTNILYDVKLLLPAGGISGPHRRRPSRRQQPHFARLDCMLHNEPFCSDVSGEATRLQDTQSSRRSGEGSGGKSKRVLIQRMKLNG